MVTFEELTFYESRVKNSFLVLAAIGFVATGIFLMTSYKESLAMAFFGLITCLFFGAAIPIGIRKITDPEIMLYLNKSYLKVFAGKHLVYFIDWKDIRGFSTKRIEHEKSIVIEMKNPEVIIENEKHSLKQSMFKEYYDEIGSPYHIKTKTLNISHKKLKRILQEFHSKFSF